MNDPTKKQLSVERAAFLLLRVRKAFRNKLTKQTRKETTQSNVNEKGGVSLPPRPPLLRSRTLPAMVVPGLSILHAQIEATVSQNITTKKKIPQVVEPLDCHGNEECQQQTAALQGAEAATEGSEELQDIREILGGLLTFDLGSPKENAVKRKVTTPKGKLVKFRNAGVKSEKASPNQYGANASPGSRSLQGRNLQGQGQTQGQTQGQHRRRLQRRHSFESSNSNLASLLGDKKADHCGSDANPPPPDVTTSNSVRPRLTFAVPDVRSSVPASPASNTKRGNKTDKSEWKKDSLELLASQGRNLSKSDLKKMEKVSGINIHLQALFAAVESGQTDKARSILEATDVDINCCNADGFTLLDVAVLLANLPMAKMLITFGAREGTEYGTREALSERLDRLLDQVENQADGVVPSQDEQSHPLLKRRTRILRKMKKELEQIKFPESPNQARAEATSENCAVVWWIQPEFSASDKTLCTKFRVEWSLSPDFQTLGGQVEVRDLKWALEGSEIKVLVENLPTNQRCFFRVASGSIGGFNSFRPTLPGSVLLSGWRCLEDRKPRFAGRLSTLDDLFAQVRNARPDRASEMRDIDDTSETPAKQRKNQTKMSLRQLFGASVKLQKNLRRGVYMACVVHHDDKILVTNEELPPVVEIDDTYPTSLHSDFHWLMKVACTWSDVKTLRQDMEKSLSSSNTHFRIKLLHAAAQLQSALGVQDLGYLYHQPVKDSQGTLLISTICHLPSAKAISPPLNFKWLPLSKLHKKTAPSEDTNAADILLNSLQELVSHRVRTEPLEKGLYIGYLKVRSSVDLLRVLVPKDTPNILPHYKIRQNSWVSSEEWLWIKSLQKKSHSSIEISQEPNDPDTGQGNGHGRGQSGLDNSSEDSQPSVEQKLFQSQVLQAAQKLLNKMGIDPEAAAQHRLYCGEVIELNAEVSLLLLLPPAESVCAVAGQTDALFDREELVTIPLQVFEMIHLRSYQKEFISRYSRLSSILEIDINLAQHAVREAFSSVELSEAKQRIMRLHDLQAQLDSTWRGSRWIMEVLSSARDRSSSMGVSLSSLSQQTPSSQAAISVFPEIPAPVKTPQTTPKFSRPRPLLKTKSENKIVGHRSPTVESLLRNNFRSSSAICSECSVPLDLPGYVSSCSSCASSRINLEQGAGDLKKEQSRSNEALSSPVFRHSNRKAISKSENQLHSIQFQPYLDAEGADETISSCQNPAISQLKTERKVQRGGVEVGLSSSMRSNSQESECSHCSRQSKSSHTPSLTSLSSAEGDPDSLSTKSGDPGDSDPLQTGVIQVYAAYESGLANGTSVKLHVTSKTTAREVVDLVVRQLNMAVTVKGKDGPVYGPDELKNFCMVAVIGARERCLRDDFRPLLLQNPWRKGRLFVRQKKDVLAAIEQSTRQIAPAAI